MSGEQSIQIYITKTFLSQKYKHFNRMSRGGQDNKLKVQINSNANFKFRHKICSKLVLIIFGMKCHEKSVTQHISMGHFLKSAFSLKSIVLSLATMNIQYWIQFIKSNGIIQLEHLLQWCNSREVEDGCLFIILFRLRPIFPLYFTQLRKFYKFIF